MPVMLITAGTFAIVATMIMALGRAMRPESAVTQRVRQLVANAPGAVAPTAGSERVGFVGRTVVGIGQYSLGATGRSRIACRSRDSAVRTRRPSSWASARS